MSNCGTEIELFFSKRQNLHDDLCLTDPSIISFGEESLLNALLYGSHSIFQNRFLRFSIPSKLSLKEQPHVMTYIISHPRCSLKQCSWNSYKIPQEKSCAEVYFSCNYNKIGLTPKYKTNMFAMFPKNVYIFLCIYKSNLCCSRK